MVVGTARGRRRTWGRVPGSVVLTLALLAPLLLSAPPEALPPVQHIDHNVGVNDRLVYTELGTNRFGDAESRLVIAKADHTEVRVLDVAAGHVNLNAEWSPNGRLIAYQKSNQVWLVDPYSPSPAPSLFDAAGGEPTFSPDGQTVLFRRVLDLYKKSLAGGDAVRFASNATTRRYHPAWSPANANVTAWVEENSTSDVRVVRRIEARVVNGIPLPSSESVLATVSGGAVRQIDFSPDGAHLAIGYFAAGGEFGSRGVFRVAMDGTTDQFFLPIEGSSGGYVPDATWAPGGQYMLYAHQEGNGHTVRYIDAANSHMPAFTSPNRLVGLDWGRPAPALSAPPGVDFGEQRIDSAGGRPVISIPRTATLGNSGRAGLVVIPGPVAGNHPGDFSYTTTCAPRSVIPPGGTCSLSISFRPTGVGPRSAVIPLTSNDPYGPTGIALTGSGIETGPSTTPAAALSPNPVDFGAVFTGNPTGLVRTAVVTSTGTAPVSIASAGVSGGDAGDFAIADDRCSGRDLVPGASCGIDVRFRPSAAGTRTSTLRVVDNAPESPHTARLLGVGSDTPVPAIEVVPGVHDFGEIGRGTASPAAALTIRSVGDAPLAVSGIDLGGPDVGEFRIAGQGDCITTLDPGDSCALQAQYLPTRPGVATGVVDVASNATATPVAVSLAGRSPDSPLLVLDRASARTGEVVVATGTGWPPGFVALYWTVGLGSTLVSVGDDGTFRERLLVFPNDATGQRALRAGHDGGFLTEAKLLVVAPSGQPGGARDPTPIELSLYFRR